MSTQQQQDPKSAKKQQQSKQEYYNSRFLDFFKESLETEKEASINQFLTHLSEAHKNKDLEQIQYFIQPSLDKIYKIYNLTPQLRKYLLILAIDTIFKQNSLAVSNTHTKLYLDMAFYAFKGKTSGFNLSINWKDIYQVFQDKYLVVNDLQQIAPNSNRPQFTNIRYLAEKLRPFYSHESVKEVFKQFKSNLNPFDNSQSLFLLQVFFKIDNRVPVEYYQEILKEIFEIKDWKNSTNFEDFFLFLIYRLSCLWKLDFSEYTEQLFGIFMKYIMEILSKSQRMHSLKPNQYRIDGIPPNNSMLTNLMVKLITPSNDPNSEKIWSNIEKIFTLIQPAVHPNNSGPWVSRILQFILSFVNNFIHRNTKEIAIRKKINKIKAKYQLISTDNSSETDAQTDAFDEIDEDDGDIKQAGGIQLVIDGSSLQNGQQGQANGGQKENQENEGDEFNEIDGDFDDDEEEDQEQYKSETSEEKQARLDKQKEDDLEFVRLWENKLLGPESKERFLQIIKPILKQVIYLNHQLISIIVKQLAFFASKEILESILPQISELLNRNDTNFTNTIKILTVCIDPLLNRKEYPKGLFQIIPIMQQTANQLSASNFQLAQRIWKLYDRIFSLIRICDPDDLIKEFGGDESELRQELNKNEEEGENVLEFYQQYSEIALTVFKKYISLFEYVEYSKAKNEPNCRANFQSVHNKFWSFVFNSSPTIFKQALDFIAESLTSSMQRKAQKYYQYLVHSFCLRDAEKTLKLVLTPTIDQIIAKRIPLKTQEEEKQYRENLEKNPLFYMVKAQPNYEEDILSYEILQINKQTLLWYLDLVEDMMQFSSIHIETYHKSINRLIFLALLNEEEQIFTKGVRIAHKIIISIISVYSKDFKLYNNIEGQNIVDHHRSIGQNQRQQFQPEWNQPDEKGRKYAKQVYNSIVQPIWNEFNSLFQNQQEKNVKIDNSNFEDLVDQMHIENHENEIIQSRKDKLKISKSLDILEQIYASINMRTLIPELLQQQKQQETQGGGIKYQEFCERFLFSEYNEEYSKYLQFIHNLFNFLISKENRDYLKDVNIGGSLLNLISLLMGMDDFNSRMLHIEKWVRQQKQFFKNPCSLTPGLNNPRINDIIVTQVEFFKRIYSYTYNLKISEQFSFIQNFLLLYSLHPYDSVSQNAVTIVYKLIPMVEDRQFIFNSMTSMLFPFLISKLTTTTNSDDSNSDNNTENKKSLVYLINQNPKLESYQLRVLSCFQTLLKLINFCLYGKVTLQCMQPLFTIFSSYDVQQVGRNDITKKQLVQSFPLFIQMLNILLKRYRLNTHTQPIYEDATSKKFIISNKIHPKDISLENMNVFTTSTQNNQEDQKQNQIFKDILFFQKFGEMTLQNDKVPGRKKSLIGLLSLMASSVFIDQEQLNDSQLKIYTDACTDEDFSLRNLGRAGLFRILRVKKAQFKSLQQQYKSTNSEQFFENLLKSKGEVEFMDYLLKLRFNQNNQNNNTNTGLKQKYVGYVDSVEEIRDYDYDLSKAQTLFQNDPFSQKIQDKAFCEQIIKFILQDVNSVKEGKQFANPMASMGLGFLQDISLLINPYFNVDVKKENLLRKVHNSNQFYIRWFKKIFQLYGYQFFKNTQELIKTYLSDLNKAEYQNFVYFYIFGLLKATLRNIAGQINKEQLVEMQNFAIDAILVNISGSSVDDYTNWRGGVSSILYTYDFNTVEPIYKALLQSQLAQNKEDQKYWRYLEIYRMFIRFFGLKQISIGENLLKEFNERVPSNDKQVYQYSKAIQDIILFVYAEPLNIKKIQQYIPNLDINQYPNIVQDTSMTVIYKSSLLKQTFQTLLENIKVKNDTEENKEIRKKYAQILVIQIEIFRISKITEVMYWYLEDILNFYIQFKEEDLEDQDIIKNLQLNAKFIATLKYQREVIPKILTTIENTGFKSDNWRIRLRALEFYTIFISNNVYVIEDLKHEYLTPVLDLLEDSNKDIVKEALQTFSDFIRISKPEVVQQMVQQLSKQAKPQKNKNNQETLVGLQGLMGILLASPYDVQPYTEDCLKVMLSHKKLDKDTEETFKNFACKFMNFQQNQDYAHEDQIVLSEEITDKLSEVANPYNYFA